MKCIYEVFVKKGEDSKYTKFERKQLRYVLIAFFVANFATFDFIAKFGFEIYPFGYIFIVLWCVVLAFAISQYHLMDIKKAAETVRLAKLATVGTLTASINHEIRNPLYIIQGLAESHLVNFEEGVYESKDVTIKESNEILKKVVVQSIRAMDIMKHFSMFAKKNINETVKPESICLAGILNDIHPLISHEFELEKVRFVKDIPENGTFIKADRRHLEEIFFNLIINACQAIKTKRQKGLISISATNLNGSIAVKVSDDGPGIQPVQLKQVFEPFFTTKKEGAGLGLYVTKQLVERNGGKISIASEFGKGTTFNLEFKR